jgi:CxxC-x17-CxxC domain-containing protein
LHSDLLYFVERKPGPAQPAKSGGMSDVARAPRRSGSIGARRVKSSVEETHDPMTLTDKILTCRDCGNEFVFTSGEQEFYAARGFTNEPGRCPECRAARRSQQSGGSYAGNGEGGYSRGPREMFSAVCSYCGREARVPFQPRLDKPVYCSDCFNEVCGGGNSYR